MFSAWRKGESDSNWISSTASRTEWKGLELNFSKNVLLWVIIAVLLVALFNLFQTSSPRGTETPVAYSDFMEQVESNQVRDVTIQGEQITGHYTDGRKFTTYAPPQSSDLVPALRNSGVRVSACRWKTTCQPSGASLFRGSPCCC